MKAKQFLINLLKGGAIGLAMIIPGVSGGTVAVLFGIYDKLVDSIGNLFKDFKNCFLFLLPILLGAVIAFAGMLIPLTYALDYAPFPTMLLFAGLMLGSVPDLIFGAKQNGFKGRDTVASIIPFIVVVAIASLGFLPGAGDVNLGSDMGVGAYFLLFAVGLLASCALVVPGVSGSMLLIILGYYNPILKALKGITAANAAHTILIFAIFAAGVILGFFTIAKLMQFLLKKFKRATFWAIVGFVLGSIPAIVITFFNSAERVATLNWWQITIGVVAFIAGAVATFFIARAAKKRTDAANAVEPLSFESLLIPPDGGVTEAESSQDGGIYAGENAQEDDITQQIEGFGIVPDEDDEK